MEYHLVYYLLYFIVEYHLVSYLLYFIVEYHLVYCLLDFIMEYHLVHFAISCNLLLSSSPAAYTITSYLIFVQIISFCNISYSYLIIVN